MADNVDISLKLGTEADISSAINAGARAGAAFAAAAQSAVNGISLSASTSMRAFATSTRQISSSADLTREIRTLGLTNGLIAQMAVARATGGNSGGNNGGWGSKPFMPAFPDPKGNNNLPQLPNNGTEVVTAEWYNKTGRAIAHLDELATKASKGGGGGGGSNVIDAEYTEKGRGLPWGAIKNTFFRGMSNAALAQAVTRPYYDYTVEMAEAEYKAETARSTRGFRQEQLDKLLAANKAKATYSRMAGRVAGGIGALLGTVIGVAAAPFTGGLSLIAAPAALAAAGGLAGNYRAREFEKESKKAEQDLLQQYKSLDESQKRYYANTLFGGNYNVSFARAVAGLGIGATEEEMMANSTTALTFRGDLARGKVSAAQMQALAFMPNTLANYINEETDPATLMAGYRADFAALGDPSLAASVAKDVTGLGTYVAATSGVYGQMANRWNMNMLGMADSMSNSVVGGYMNRQAFNTVTDQLTAAAMFMKNAHDAPESFWGGQAKPTDKENDWGNFLYRWRQMVSTQGQLNNMPPMIINLNVDGETLKSVNVGEQIKERTSFLTGGQSFIAGGY